jgi:hypothetical protein
MTGRDLRGVVLYRTFPDYTSYRQSGVKDSTGW